MEAKYPGKIIIVNEIVDSPARFAERPDVTESAAPSSVAARLDDDAVQRARERLAKLRGEF
jgi:hypothetical protein